MGSTMHAAVQMCQNSAASRIVVAVPVAGARSVSEFSRIVDELIVLESPINFYAVAQAYEHWYDVSDKEVLTRGFPSYVRLKCLNLKPKKLIEPQQSSKRNSNSGIRGTILNR